MSNITKSINNLREIERDHYDIGKKIMTVSNREIYPMDMYAIAVINRSVALLSGFCDEIEKKNFICAAPLLRLQLDNLFRFQAAWLVDKPHDFVQDVISGKQINQIKDRDGKNMSDNYLVKKLSIEYPMLNDLYKNTSGFIHLSDKHIFSSFGNPNDGGKLNSKISATDSFVSEKDYLSAIRAFFEITGILFRYLEGWAQTKEMRYQERIKNS